MKKKRYVLEQQPQTGPDGQAGKTSSGSRPSQSAASNGYTYHQHSGSDLDGKMTVNGKTAENNSGHNISSSGQSQPGATDVDVPHVEVTSTSADRQLDSQHVTVAGKEAEEDEDNSARGCCGQKKKDKIPSVGAFEMFRFAGPVDVVMMVVGTLAAMAGGTTLPLGTMFIGDILDIFVNTTTAVNGTNQTDGQHLMDAIQPVVIILVLISVGSLVSSYLAVSLWVVAGERQITKIRKQFFRGVLRQDMAWFDTHDVGQLNSRFSDDMHKVGDGLGDKVPIFMEWFCFGMTAYIIAFYKAWKLSVVVFACGLLFVAVTATTSRFLRTIAMTELNAYAEAGSLAEQALRAIRTVQAFQGQEKEENKYRGKLGTAQKVGIRKGLVLGVGYGLFYLLFYMIGGVTFYYGVVLIRTEGLLPGNVLIAFFNILSGSMHLGQAFPNLEAFSNARAAAFKIYETISLRPTIDITSTAGRALKSLTGVIEFKDVHFRYPARPDVPVLRGLNLKVQPGQTVALVGSSGCGKSTVLQLLQRFYDPDGGQVCLDGHDIRDLNLQWLRNQIAVVSQEPVLFAASIADNIRYGHMAATQQQVQAAAKMANVHDFIVQLPQGYNTVVGEKGAQLSGGQKQRIAIARALVKNPRILLLDEATSALDHESEAMVQNALEKAEEGRTTFVVAHRLSTIRHADLIVTISQGQRVEQGSHEELMSLDGLYAQLIKLQSRAEDEEDDDEGVEEDDDDDDDSEFSLVPSGTSPAGTSAALDKPDGATLRRSSRKSGQLKRKERKTSSSDNDSETKKDKKEENEISIRELLRLSSPDWVFVSVGAVLCIIFGISYSTFGIVVSLFLQVFSIEDEDEQTRMSLILAGTLGGVGLFICLCSAGSTYCFGRSGAALTARLRRQAFHSMLRQDMSFFDSSKNQVGNLTTQLASDTALVQGASGNKLASMLEAMAILTSAIVVGMIYGWKLTLVVLGIMPVNILAAWMRGRVVAGSSKAEHSHLQEAGKICSEAVDNIRTLVAINREDIFIRKLDKILDSATSGLLKRSQVFGVTYGVSYSIGSFNLAICMAFGTYLVSLSEMEFHNIFRVVFVMLMASTVVGRQLAAGVDFTKGRQAAGRLTALIKRVPQIDVNRPGGQKLAEYRGRVAMEGLVFHYPNRDSVRVLAGLTLAVEPGQTLALVGRSGCGKSTALQLLQRFYDPDNGKVLVDGQDLSTMDLCWFRQQLGVVSQEPSLFDDTIAANIAYGDNSRHVPMEEIIAAARAANIHNFIDSLPQGYDTNVGDKGTQLSGGQKQRIAIARALVRQPKVLLLDEATSALDTESERVVQEALDRARQGRTCIVIAHRLTTIQNADQIAVLRHGRVEEIGSHSQLMQREGAYFTLLQAQASHRKRSV